MQEIGATQTVSGISLTRGRGHSGRWMFVAAVFVTLVLLAVLPPLISVSRYQHRISTSISTSLGRPVHFDQVSLNLLPVPSFTLTNFVVEEDPGFGAEPIIRANTVTATLRVSSLWRRRVEFSRISFTETSINLVHRKDGAWNFQSILLQAAQLQSAPTDQRRAGPAPRFPYIEATGARLNLKMGDEKTPFSLTEADFALWLPDPAVWKMRLQGRPMRTDMSVQDTGALHLEATLGRASSLDEVPLDVQAAWRSAPLGEASRMLFARDLGLRGEVTVTAALRGNLSRNLIETRVEVNRLRRSEFVPEKTLSLDIHCRGSATRVFRTLMDLRCSWPVPDGNGATLALAGSVGDVRQPATADIQIGTAGLPAAVALDWLRVASSRIAPGLIATGAISGSVSHGGLTQPGWAGLATLPELRLSGGKLGATPLTVKDVMIQTTERSHAEPVVRSAALGPVELPLGGKDPAILEAQVDASGYSMHLAGMVVLARLSALALSVPPFGDSLVRVLPTNRAAGPVRVDLSARREWGGEVVWEDTLAYPGRTMPRQARTTFRGRRR